MVVIPAVKTELQTPQQTLADRTPDKPPAVCSACGKPKRVMLIVFLDTEKQQWCVKCVVSWVGQE